MYAHGFYSSLEAQKKAEVAVIEYEQKIKERESMKKMSSIEGTPTRNHMILSLLRLPLHRWGSQG